MWHPFSPCARFRHTRYHRRLARLTVNGYAKGEVEARSVTGVEKSEFDGNEIDEYTGQSVEQEYRTRFIVSGRRGEFSETGASKSIRTPRCTFFVRVTIARAYLLPRRLLI